MEMKLTTICNNDPQDHLQVVAGRPWINLGLDTEPYKDSRDREYIKLSCGCTYYHEIEWFYKRIATCDLLTHKTCPVIFPEETE